MHLEYVNCGNYGHFVPECLKFYSFTHSCMWREMYAWVTIYVVLVFISLVPSQHGKWTPNWHCTDHLSSLPLHTSFTITPVGLSCCCVELSQWGPKNKHKVSIQTYCYILLMFHVPVPLQRRLQPAGSCLWSPRWCTRSQSSRYL